MTAARSRTLLAATGATLALGAPSPGAGAAPGPTAGRSRIATVAARRPACAHPPGRSIFASATLRVSVKRGGRRGIVFACVPPAGAVRVAAVAYDETVDFGYSIAVAATAGTWIALRTNNVIDPHTSEQVFRVFDARTGRSYNFFSVPFPEQLAPEEQPVRGEVVHVALNSFGQLAFALAEAGRTRIFAVAPSGAHRVLDSAPEAQIVAASLRVQGHTAYWVDAGAQRSATL